MKQAHQPLSYIIFWGCLILAPAPPAIIHELFCPCRILQGNTCLPYSVRWAWQPSSYRRTKKVAFIRSIFSCCSERPISPVPRPPERHTPIWTKEMDSQTPFYNRSPGDPAHLQPHMLQSGTSPACLRCCWDTCNHLSQRERLTVSHPTADPKRALSQLWPFVLHLETTLTVGETR